MSTYTGILVDVSGSMSNGANEEGGSWARSMFTLIDNFVKRDASRNNHIFTIGFGGKDKGVFDTIGSIKSLQEENDAASNTTIENIFDVLEENGARTIRKWASTRIISQAVSQYKARILLEKLREDLGFRRQFVNEYLPRACRDWDDTMPENDDLLAAFGIFLRFAQTVYSAVRSYFHQVRVKDIECVVKKALPSINTTKGLKLTDVSDQSVYTVREAAYVIRGSIFKQEVTTERARELLRIFEPFIFGSTPLYYALNVASDLFTKSLAKYRNHRRLLFVLSDGGASDRGDINRIMSQLRHAGVTVVTCYISSSSNVESRKLHSSEGYNWDEGAKFLFSLSSKIPTDWSARAIFIKRGWKIDFNNETRFFMHINHPDNLKEVYDIAQNAV